MRIVVALGGNALQRRGEPMTVEGQRANVAVACRSLAPVAIDHELVISHGNGPQVGLLALQASAYDDVSIYPFDVLGAQTEGMIGYLIEQELGNLVPAEKRLATVLTMTEVDPADPAFEHPTKFVGPVYTPEQAEKLAEQRGWVFHADGDKQRRVVPSPIPQRIIEIDPIQWLLQHRCVVVCAGGGGIPVADDGVDTAGPDGHALRGVEAVIDKDLTAAILARDLDADTLVIATDVPHVMIDFGKPGARPLERMTCAELREHAAAGQFARGSMGPKVEAALRFVESGPAAARRRAVITSLEHIADAVDSDDVGTVVRTS